MGNEGRLRDVPELLGAGNDKMSLKSMMPGFKPHSFDITALITVCSGHPRIPKCMFFSPSEIVSALRHQPSYSEALREVAEE